MKLEELRQLAENDLNARISALREEIYNLRFQKATRQSATTQNFSALRREIAQIYTVLRENELGIRSLAVRAEGE